MNGDAVVARCCRWLAGGLWFGLGCFEMEIPWKDGVTGGQSFLGGA